MKRQIQATIVILAAGIFFTGCSSTEDDSSVEMLGLLAATKSGASDGLSGSVIKGPVRSATVYVYRIEEDGSLSGPVEETTTDELGHFAFQHKYSGERIEIVTEAGSYDDEATGDSVALQTQNRLRLQLAATEEHGDLTVSPLTTMARERVRARLLAGETNQDGLIIQAREEVATMFGLSGIDPGQTDVDDLTDATSTASRNRNQTKYGLVLAGMSQALSDAGASSSEMPDVINCYNQDIADGDIDGYDGDTAVSCEGTVTAMQMHQNMEQAMNQFMNNTRNKHRSDLSGMDVPAPQNQP